MLRLEELEPLPDDVQAFADVDERGQTRLGVAGDQLAVLPLPAPITAEELEHLERAGVQPSRIDAMRATRDELEPKCPDCGDPWRPGMLEPSCPSCGLELEDLEAAAAFLERL